MEKRGGAVDKAPHFYIKSRTTEPRLEAHEIHTPGGTLICIPRTRDSGIPPVARCAVAHCRAMCCVLTRSVDATPTKASEASAPTLGRAKRGQRRPRGTRRTRVRPLCESGTRRARMRERARTWTICDDCGPLPGVPPSIPEHATRTTSVARCFSGSCLARPGAFVLVRDDSRRWSFVVRGMVGGEGSPGIGGARCWVLGAGRFFSLCGRTSTPARRAVVRVCPVFR